MPKQNRNRKKSLIEDENSKNYKYPKSSNYDNTEDTKKSSNNNNKVFNNKYKKYKKKTWNEYLKNFKEEDLGDNINIKKLKISEKDF